MTYLAGSLVFSAPYKRPLAVALVYHFSCRLRHVLACSRSKKTRRSLSLWLGTLFPRFYRLREVVASLLYRRIGVYDSMDRGRADTRQKLILLSKGSSTRSNRGCCETLSVDDAVSDSCSLNTITRWFHR
jgi:hypothetical protein